MLRADRVEPLPQRGDADRVVLQHQVEGDRISLLGPPARHLADRLDQPAQLPQRLGGEQQRGPRHHQDVPGARQPGHVGEQRSERRPVLRRVTGQLQRRADLVQEAVRRPSTVAAEDPDHDPVLAQQPAQLPRVRGRGVQQVQPRSGRPAQPRQLRSGVGDRGDDAHYGDMRATARILFIASRAATL